MRSILLAATMLGGALCGATSAFADPIACAELAAHAGPGVRIDSARPIPAGTLPTDNPGRAALTGAARAQAAMPAHCLVTGVIHPRTGVGGQSFGDSFELRMPDAWNGKFLFQGGGGMDGFVGEAVGAIPIAGATAAPALNRGYAVVSTDSGHHGDPKTPGGPAADGAFASDQQARIDYFYASIGDVGATAKRLIEARYARPPEHSYFMGCSNGGRSAMIAAQRFPLDFDGVIAGNPAFRVSQAAMALLWETDQLTAIAPKDAEGQPILSRALSDADLRLVKQSVLKACDGADGLVDGSIDARSQCHFDVASLRCTGAKTDQCLTAPQVEALAATFDGPHDSKGHAIYPGYTWDSSIDAPTWRPWVLGDSQTSVSNARNSTLVINSIKQQFLSVPDVSFDPAKFDFDRDPTRLAASAAANDAISTLYSSFTAHGGRMLIYHGYGDPVFSAPDLIGYYDGLARDNGGPAKLREWARLFMVPGMTHCGGGQSLDDFDPLTALETWVEKGQAPDKLLASGASFPGRSRPLCPYPQESRYTGKGDINDAANFTCSE